MPRSRCRRRTALELPGLRRMPVDRAVAQRLFEQAERLEVLGGAPGDEAGASAAPAEGERQRPEPRRGQPVEVVERQPGEPGPGRHREQAGGAGPEHGRGAPAGVAEQPLQQAVEGGRVEVDPRPGGEIAGCGSALQQRMALEGGPAGRPDPGAGARSAGAAGTMKRGSGMREGIVFGGRCLRSPLLFRPSSCSAYWSSCSSRLFPGTIRAAAGAATSGTTMALPSPSARWKQSGRTGR